MKKLSIIIPAYNESNYILSCLKKAAQIKIDNWTKEIIVIDDGSTDNTLELVQEFTKNNTKIKLLSHSENRGKGAALKQGIKKTTGDIIIIQDADLEYDPADYLTILEVFKKKEINVVYGSRILGEKVYHNHNAGLYFLLGGIILTKIVNIMLGTKLTDQPTCYKSWRNILSDDLLKFCKSDGFEFEVEMTAFFAKFNKIREVPIRYYPRTVSHGKKIGLVDFIKSILMVFKCRFKYQSSLPSQ